MKKPLTYLFLGICIILISAIGVRSAIQSISGLAVAESSTKWNNVKDASQGDNLTNGILAVSPYLYDGTNFDSARGDTTNGIDVDVTRLNDGGNIISVDDGAGSLTVDGTVTVVTPVAGTAFYAIKKALSATAVTNEVLGTGDGTVTAFSGTLANFPVVRSSITVSYTIAAAGYTATDDGAGTITGTSVSGTINYTTGAWTLTFTTAPDNATDITADYTYITSTNIAFGFTSKKIIVETDGANSDNLCIDWIGGAAECPAANTAGDDIVQANRVITLDDYAATSISITTDSTSSQTVYVRAFN